MHKFCNADFKIIRHVFSQIKIKVKLLKEITSHCLYMHTWVLEYIVESKKLRGIEAKTSVVLVVKHPLSFIVPQNFARQSQALSILLL